MKGKQFVKRLRKQGVEIISGRGKGGHVLAKYHEKQTTIPIHGDADLGPEFLKKVCKQLGINPKEIL